MKRHPPLRDCPSLLSATVKKGDMTKHYLLRIDIYTMDVNKQHVNSLVPPPFSLYMQRITQSHSMTKYNNDHQFIKNE